MKSGVLYGIGVGPGDPDLITLKAVRVLGVVDVVFAAASTKNRHSQAVKIAAPHLKADAPVRMLSFPMTRNAGVLSQAWEDNAQKILEVLNQGKNAAFLTLGDCLTYSTYGYIVRALKRLSPDARVESVPGITSYQAAAARMNTPLVEGEESLLVVSGVNGGGRFRGLSPKPENVVFLKAYKNAGDIADALEEADRIQGGVGVVRCGMTNEQVIGDVRAFREKRPDYWTLILSKIPKEENPESGGS